MITLKPTSIVLNSRNRPINKGFESFMPQYNFKNFGQNYKFKNNSG